MNQRKSLKELNDERKDMTEEGTSGACFFKNQQLDFYKLSYTV